MGGAMATDETGMATMLDVWLENDPDKEVLLAFYDQYIAGSTYEDNMNLFGKVSYDAPASISIYTDSFEDKDAIATCIENYNETVSEDVRARVEKEGRSAEWLGTNTFTISFCSMLRST